MIITNQFITQPYTPTSWEKTDDGFLRVKARVLAERIMAYNKAELSTAPEMCPNVINMLVTCESMNTAEARRTLEGAQVVAPDHVWVTPNNCEVSKGNTAGAAHLDGPYLVIDMIITDPQTIEDIESGRIGEISAGYHADTIFEAGDYDGQKYDAKQVQLRFNHIAIIPKGMGRAGEDVRIVNKRKEKAMEVVKVKLRNGKFINTDEEGAKAVEESEQMQNEEVTEGAKSIEDLMSQVEALNAQIEALKAEAEEGKGELSVYKEKLDELLSTEAVEHAAEQLTSERAEGMEILENAMEEGEEKEQVKNSIKGLRGTTLHTAVLSAVGVKVENMSSEAIRGAFKAQSQLVKNGFTNRKSVAGAKLMNSMTPSQTNGAPTQRTALERLGFKK